jgi:transposase
MVSIENESNVEVLRQYVLWLEGEVKGLAKENLDLKNIKEIEKQQFLDDKLRDQLSKLRELFFAKGREILAPKSGRPVGHVDQKLNVHNQHHKKESLKKQKALERTETEHTINEEGLKKASLDFGLPGGSSAWEKLEGLYAESKLIEIYEKRYFEVLHKRAKYKTKKEIGPGKVMMITAGGPALVKPGMSYSPSFAVSVVIDKYEYHLPLERQRRKMSSLGLDVEVKTLYGLCEAVSEHCSAIIPRIKSEMFKDFCGLHMDETPWPILGADKNGYMWVMTNRLGVIYQFEPTRSGAVAEEMLKGYSGSVVSDAFSGYSRFKGRKDIRLGFCWSHVRREFYDRREHYPEEAKRALELIDPLFHIENKVSDMEELRVLRQTESLVQVEKIRDWLFEIKPKYRPSEGITKAIAYALGNWTELTLFLKDLTVQISNNSAERSLRPVVMGRKNFGGSKTINGADTAASIYSVIETCKRLGLEPTEYLKYLIEARWEKNLVKTPKELVEESAEVGELTIYPSKELWEVN